MPQAQTGSRRSIPKLTRVNADDRYSALYKNLGDGRRIPFMWGMSVNLASGTTPSVVVASGVNFNGFRACDAVVQVTPTATGTGTVAHPDATNIDKVYVVKNTDTNIVTLKSTATMAANTRWDVTFFMGLSAEFDGESNMLWKPSSNKYQRQG